MRQASKRVPHSAGAAGRASHMAYVWYGFPYENHSQHRRNRHGGAQAGGRTSRPYNVRTGRDRVAPAAPLSTEAGKNLRTACCASIPHSFPARARQDIGSSRGIGATSSACWERSPSRVVEPRQSAGLSYGAYANRPNRPLADGNPLHGN
jgi:hypothetical protein